MARLRARRGGRPAVWADPASVDWFALGCHPDVVEHIWRRIPAATGAVPWLVEGAVIAARGGRVIAVGYGTTYAIRVPESTLAEADAGGYSPAHRWGAGWVTDVAEELGPGWRFGRWDDRELEWLSR